MKEQLNMMQSQFQMLISTLGNANKNEMERNSIAKNLYESGLIKEAEKWYQQQQQRQHQHHQQQI